MPLAATSIPARSDLREACAARIWCALLATRSTSGDVNGTAAPGLRRWSRSRHVWLSSWLVPLVGFGHGVGDVSAVTPAVLDVDVEGVAILAEVNAGGLSVAVSDAGEPHRFLGRWRPSPAGHRHPDVVSTRLGRRGAAWILGDVEVPVVIQCEVVG